MDLKVLCEDIAADGDLSNKNDFLFQHYRKYFKALERREPPQDDNKVMKLQQRIRQRDRHQ
jgi:hypothetical protein